MNPREEMDVSIILPVRNAAQFLDEAMSAIYAQQHIRFEVIVMDGNSSDDTFAVVQKWLRPEDIYVSGPDNGIYDAINKGIAQARGKWIYIQGADDGLAHDLVLSHFLSHAGTASRLIFGDVEYKNPTSHWVKKRHVSTFGWKLLFRNTLHQQSVLYHRSLFERNRFDIRFKILADYAFHLKLFFGTRRTSDFVVYLQTVLAYCGAEGVSKKFTKKLYQEEWRVRQANLPFVFLLLTFFVSPLKYWIKARR